MNLELDDGQGDHHSVVMQHESALARAIKVFGPNAVNTAVALNELATLYHSMGKHDRAEPLYRRSLKISEAKLGKNHPNVAGTSSNLAALHLAMGRYAQAKPLYERSLRIREISLGKDHPDVARCLIDLAGLYVEVGQHDYALQLCQRGLKIYEDKLGENHLEVAASLNNLAIVYMEMGKYDQAELHCRRSLKIREAKLGDDHPDVAETLNNLAILCGKLGKHDHAESFWLRSLKIRETQLGKQHPEVANSLSNLAALYANTGQYSRAEPLLRRNLKICEDSYGENHPEVANCLSSLAILYTAMGQYDQAEPLFLRSLKIKETRLGEQHPEAVEIRGKLAELYEFMAEGAQAELREWIPRKAELIDVKEDREMELELDETGGAEEFPPLPPGPLDFFDNHAKKKEVISMFRVLCSAGIGALNFGREFDTLYRHLRARFRKNPAKMADELTTYSLSLIAYLQLRTAYSIEHLLRQQAQYKTYDPGIALPHAVMSDLLPSLIQLQKHQAEMLQLQATTERQRELARAKRIENDRVSPATRQLKSQQVAAKPWPDATIAQEQVVEQKAIKTTQDKRQVEMPQQAAAHRVKVPPLKPPQVKCNEAKSQVEAPPTPELFDDSEEAIEKVCQQPDYEALWAEGQARVQEAMLMQNGTT